MIWILYILLVGAFFVCMISCIDINRLKIQEYTIESDKINEDVTIVFLSDMHNKEHGTDNYRLVEEVRKANPDILLIGGDMLTARQGCSIEAPIKLADYIKEYDTYYGIGNHEYRMKLYTEDYGESFELLVGELELRGIHVLQNESRLLEKYNIEIQGLMIDRRFYKRFSKQIMDQEYLENTIGKRNNDVFRIILAHNPEYFSAYSKEGDLVLSGHVHGGIMKLPFLGGVISPRLKLFPKYDGGRFDENGSTMIISRGLGVHTLPIRIFNPAEVVVIKLKSLKGE